ncbi:hypothetical protein [Microbacterium maritypicum]|uniref:Uncharacterized protein n=1 Tax=Microbacterium maritypicum MF109 TaxID=1333857 RepID=T5L1F2_MICMQ|nr:hypothetical protein [Microbacterium liquefaciens]EQM86129.1 hypothetical protein L687_10455 [Microbacterium maritypicum MF109]
MNTHLASRPAETGPINPDWTIAQLLEWLSDDVRQHEVTLQHPLARIEASLTGARWARTPSTVALIRSIAAAVRDEPVRGSIRVGELSLQQAPRMPERIPQPA